MSLEMLNACARHSEAQGNARIVLMGLAFYAQQQTGLAWPGDTELLTFTRLSKSQLYRSLRSLEASRQIIRQPRTEGQPRRVYLIDPLAATQLELFASEASALGANVSGVTRLSDEGERVTQVAERSPTRARGKNHRNHKDNPPNPPTRGERHTPDLIQGITAPRPSRRRRGNPGCPSEPCPGGPDPAGWPGLRERLRGLVGEQHWQVWFAGAHCHERDGVIVIALDPERVDWTAARFGPALAAAAEQLAFVGCQELGRRR